MEREQARKDATSAFVAERKAKQVKSVGTRTFQRGFDAGYAAGQQQWVDVDDRASEMAKNYDYSKGTPTVVMWMADFARIETATLTTQLNEMREALRELLESAKHAQMETHETFTSNTLFDAVVKAEKIFDTDAQ